MEAESADGVKALQNPSNQPNGILALHNFADQSALDILLFRTGLPHWQGLFGWKAGLGETLEGDMGVYKKAYVQFFDVAYVCEMKKWKVSRLKLNK